MAVLAFKAASNLKEHISILQNQYLIYSRNSNSSYQEAKDQENYQWDMSNVTTTKEKKVPRTKTSEKLAKNLVFLTKIKTITLHLNTCNQHTNQHIAITYVC